MVAFDQRRFDSHANAMLLCSSEGRVLDANPSARFLLGHSLPHLQTLDLAGLSAVDEGFTAARLAQHLARGLEQDAEQFPWRVRVSGGASVPTVIDLVRLDELAGETRLIATMSNQETPEETLERAAPPPSRSGVLGALAGLGWGLHGAWLGAVIGAVLACLATISGGLGGGGGLLLTLLLLPLMLAFAALGGGAVGGLVGLVVGALLGLLASLFGRAIALRTETRDDAE